MLPRLRPPNTNSHPISLAGFLLLPNWVDQVSAFDILLSNRKHPRQQTYEKFQSPKSERSHVLAPRRVKLIVNQIQMKIWNKIDCKTQSDKEPIEMWAIRIYPEQTGNDKPLNENGSYQSWSSPRVCGWRPRCKLCTQSLRPTSSLSRAAGPKPAASKHLQPGESRGGHDDSYAVWSRRRQWENFSKVLALDNSHSTSPGSPARLVVDPHRASPQDNQKPSSQPK